MPEFSLPWFAYLIAIAGGYLLGSIPFGLVFTRLAGLGDIRQIGSGNIGATNVLRTGRKGLALATLIADSGKAALVAILAKLYADQLGVIAGAAALLGHLFPVWLNFKGGKGVATFLGTLLAVHFPAGALACLTWLATAFVSRYSSLSALIASAAAPVYLFLFGQTFAALVVLALAALVYYRHEANIRRLLAGEEPKIGKKKQEAE